MLLSLGERAPNCQDPKASGSCLGGWGRDAPPRDAPHQRCAYPPSCRHDACFAPTHAPPLMQRGTHATWHTPTAPILPCAACHCPLFAGPCTPRPQAPLSLSSARNPASTHAWTRQQSHSTPETPGLHVRPLVPVSIGGAITEEGGGGQVHAASSGLVLAWVWRGGV